MKIGFDLWGTLLEANPLFKERKKDLFNKHFPYLPSVNFEGEMYSIKTDLNRIIEDSGWQPNDSIIHNMIATRFGTTIDKVYHFMLDYQKLAIIYAPLLILPTTKQVLENLYKSNELHIVSNTMFIKGESLREHLNYLGIADYFSSMRFSDIEKNAKPDRKICNQKFDYFVGDNLHVDGTYAKNINAKFIQINSNDKTLYDAYNIIIKG
jgi:putative hydrolase of the HAD superfamily